jgi:hypothetical protein
VDNAGFGFSAEFQLLLDQRTDMSHEDFTISFDIYVAGVTYEKGVNVQFGLHRIDKGAGTDGEDLYTPIYSKWWARSVHADQWVTLTAAINTDAESRIDYSEFENDPADWIFDAVRIQTIINGTQAVEGDEILFYVDNLVIDNLASAGE